MPDRTSRTRPSGILEPGPGAWKTLGVSSGVPRTVKAIDTAELIRLDVEAIAYGFNRNHDAGWLAEHAALEAMHYLRPVLVHRARRTRLRSRSKLAHPYICLLIILMRLALPRWARSSRAG
ncbi:hypothetical protein C1A38_22780 [Verrucosispora sp. ts21]|nr:hypothetical protein C1A38_22780 [Verrucosispora sp. ts21]